MMLVLVVLAMLAVAPCAWAIPAPAGASGRAPCGVALMTSALAPPVLRGASQVPELWLAQRSIEREWGPSEDSTYRVIDVKGWKSEGMALALSGALPGAGQLYVGEGSGWAYVLGEALGWAGRVVMRKRATDLRDQAAAFVGDPTDSSSTWSFERYARASGGDATLLEALWSGDRDAFYQALANDPSYRAGFSGNDPDATYDSYRGLRDSSQDRFRQSHLIELALWANHMVSAFDALRAARIHNLPLRRTIDLQLGARMHHGEPVLRAALVRRF